LQTVISVGVVVATLFTLWTPENLFSNRLLEQMLVSIQPTPGIAGNLPTPTESPRPRIGIVAGHAGNDSGSVCADGLTEAQVNMKIATLVQQDLMKEGYDVDLLQEFDSRLSGYHGLALISIHNDSCDYINDEATGFKVAAAMSNPHPEKATRLTACLVQRYQAATNMRYHYNTITDDMTQYHAFSEINNQTTAAIIETGFLNLDRQILVEQTDKVAQGVVNGILCFIRNEDVPTQALPTP
jgi:N-acetylmuramoyl-L-alanine amidase